MREHKCRVYVDNHGAITYAYRCTGCTARDGGYIVAAYARDAWREAHDMPPLINRPLA